MADQDLVQFLDNPFLGQDAHPVFHRLHRANRLRNDREALLRGAELNRETDRPKHPERIIAVGLLWLKRGPDDTGRKVPYPPERINQRSEIVFLQTESHRVYREIPPELVLFKGSVLNYRLA